MAEKDSKLDSLMKGIGRRLGTRRRDVHKAIERFHEEVNNDETPMTDTNEAEQTDVESSSAGAEETTSSESPRTSQ